MSIFGARQRITQGSLTLDASKPLISLGCDILHQNVVDDSGRGGPTRRGARGRLSRSKGSVVVKTCASHLVHPIKKLGRGIILSLFLAVLLCTGLFWTVANLVLDPPRGHRHDGRV